MLSFYYLCLKINVQCVTIFIINFFFRIFGHKGEEAENVLYCMWLNMVWSGTAKALETYQPNNKVWLQVNKLFKLINCRSSLDRLLWDCSQTR